MRRGSHCPEAAAEEEELREGCEWREAGAAAGGLVVFFLFVGLWVRRAYRDSTSIL